MESALWRGAGFRYFYAAYLRAPGIPARRAVSAIFVIAAANRAVPGSSVSSSYLVQNRSRNTPLMVGGRFDSALMSRMLAICAVARLWRLPARAGPAGWPRPQPPTPSRRDRPFRRATRLRRVRCRKDASRRATRRAGIQPRRKLWKFASKETRRSSCTRSCRTSRPAPGRPLDKSTVEDDVKRLTKTHQFINVEPRYERTPDGGIVIIFHVVERPHDPPRAAFTAAARARKPWPRRRA